MLKIRIIGINSCSNCKSLVRSYKAQKVDFEYWDADSPDLEKTLDEMKVFDVPVVQLVDGDKVVFQSDPAVYKRGISYYELKHEISSYAKRSKNAG